MSFIEFPENPTLGQLWPPDNAPAVYKNRWQWVGNRWNLVKDIPLPTRDHEIASKLYVDTFNPFYWRLRRKVVKYIIPEDFNNILNLTGVDAETEMIILSGTSLANPLSELVIRRIRINNNVKELILTFDNIAKIVIEKDFILTPDHRDMIFYGNKWEWVEVGWRFWDRDDNPPKIVSVLSSCAREIQRPIGSGLLYNAFTFEDPRGIAPEGWRMPTFQDANIMMEYLGDPSPLVIGGPAAGSSVAGFHLKSESRAKTLNFWDNTQPDRRIFNLYPRWNTTTAAGQDTYGFNAIPAGGRDHVGTAGFGSGFSGINIQVYFWLSTPSGDYIGWFGFLSTSDGYMHNWADKRHGFSIRFIKENPDDWEEGDLVKDKTGNFYRTCKVGDQVWTAQSFAGRHYNNGDEIPNVNLKEEWITLSTGARCYYGNNIMNY